LNPEKCKFGVKADKFLDFLLTRRGIEANPNKCKAVLGMSSPRSIKEVQQLTGRIAALSEFLPDSAKKCLPLFKLLRHQEDFMWDEACIKEFSGAQADIDATSGVNQAISR
jgi:hypothetical protein